MERPLKTLGILHIVYGGITFLSMAPMMWAIGPLNRVLGILNLPAHIYVGRISDLHFLPHYLTPILYYVMIAPLIVAFMAVVGGWGTYVGKNWGKVVVLLVGVVSLINLPFGTALGIYTIWVLLRPQPAPASQSG